MRENLFRGKTQRPCGEWIYGSLLTNYPCCKYEVDETVREYYIIDGKEKELKMVQVIPKTVGQFTGLTDKNGNKIFEGDIIEEVYDTQRSSRYEVRMSEERGGWYPFAKDDGCGCCSWEVANSDRCEIIGNTHDNLELLKGGG